MEQVISRKLDMLMRVDGLLSSVPELAPLAGSTVRASLTATIAAFASHAVDQEHGARESRGATQTKTVALRELNERMLTISAAARMKLRASPDFVRLSMPARRLATQRLIAVAEAMVVAGAANHAALVEAGLSPGFVDDLSAAIAAVRSAIQGRDDHLSRRAGATDSMQKLSSDVQALIKMLTGMVKQLIPPGDPNGLLVRWNQAKRIGRKRGPMPVAVTPEVTPKAA